VLLRVSQSFAVLVIDDCQRESLQQFHLLISVSFLVFFLCDQTSIL